MGCWTDPAVLWTRGVTVSSLACVERDGFVWVWPGNLLPSELPTYGAAPSGFDVHAEIEVWLVEQCVGL